MALIAFEPIENSRAHTITFDVNGEILTVGIVTSEGRNGAENSFDNIPDALRSAAELIDREARRTKCKWRMRIEISAAENDT